MKEVAQQFGDAVKDTVGLRDRVESRPTIAENISAQDQIRLTQALHDELREYFAALSFYARMLTDDLNRERSAHGSEAERMVALIRRINDVMRRLNRILRVQGTEADD